MGVFARILLALVLVWSTSTASTTDPLQLLREVSENYRHLRSFEFAGHLTTTIPDVGIRVRIETMDAEADHSFVPKTSSLLKYGDAKQFHKVTFSDAHGKPAQPNLRFGLPGRWGGFDRIDVGRKTATELPSETINFDSVPVQCRVVEVVYVNEMYDLGEESFKYWIDPNRRLVLKEEFVEREGRERPPVFWRWVYTVDSVKLNQPPPEWLVESGNHQFVDHPRLEWVGRTAPRFVLSDLDGHEVDSSSMLGSVVVLDFWAVWCGPCRKELPIIEDVSQDYKSEGVQVWGISLDDKPSKVKKWMSENHAEFRTAIDPDGKTASEYEVGGIPSLVVINPYGKVISYYEGKQSEQSLRTAINFALHDSTSKSR